MPPRTSPPPTPVSSPRASPTPTSPSPTDAPDADSATQNTSSASTSSAPTTAPQGLSPSTIPLRPVHAPAQDLDAAASASPNSPGVVGASSAGASGSTSPTIRTVAPTQIQLEPASDDMDIDDGPMSHSIGSSSPVANNANGHNGNNNASSDDGGSEPDWSTDDWMVDMRRVKVYELVGATWTDRGTALCTGVYDEDLDTAAIVAKSELNDVELLRSEIRASDVYQKQQDTLIVWTEPDGTDYALSFQDMEGCSEIWDFIVEVQRHFRGKGQGDPNSSFSSSSGDAQASSSQSQSRLTVASIIASGRLPEPALGIINDLDTAIKAIAKTIHGRERISEYILNEDYIKALIDVMEQAEDLESLPDLHALHGIIQTILSMNDHGIYDYVLHEDIFLGVVGILEYDPEFPTYKASYRDFLSQTSTTQHAFEFQDVTVQRKIAQTYRLQFLKDVVLARVIDDSTFNVLNSFILFNQIEIVNYVVAPENGFLGTLLAGFEDVGHDVTSAEPNGVNGHGSRPGQRRETAPSPPPSPGSILQQPSPALTLSASTSNANAPTPLHTKSNGISSPATKADVVRFVHQLCLMAKNVQIPTRLALYRALVERGVLDVLEWALRVDPSSISPSSSQNSGVSISLTVPNSDPSKSRPSEPTPSANPNLSADPDPPLLDMAAEIFVLVAEFNLAGVRGHIVRQAERAKAMLPGSSSAPNSTASTSSIGLINPFASPNANTSTPNPVPIPASGKPVDTLVEREKESDLSSAPNLLRALLARLGGTKYGPAIAGLGKGKENAVAEPFRSQVGDAIRLLLESPPAALDFAGATVDGKGNSVIKLREDPINEHFFPVFYDPTLVSAFYKPLLDLDDWKDLPGPVLKLTREQSALFLYLCDLLCTLLIQHSHRSQYFILSAGISAKIASLLRTRDKHMRLAALRYFRTCIRINNHYMIRHLMKNECFSPIITLAAQEAGRDNLVSASCQEFFETIRKDNLRLPMTHIMEKYEPRIRALAEEELVGPRFRAFILRWEQNSAPPPPPPPAPSTTNIISLDDPESRKWGQGTILEAEEESYFNASDDEDESADTSGVLDSGLGDVSSELGSPGWSVVGDLLSSNASTMRSMREQTDQESPTKKRGSGSSAARTTGPAAAGRRTRSVTAAAAMAAAGVAGSRPDTPTPNSPDSSPEVNRTISVPKAYPMRSLLDYGEEDDDEDSDGGEVIGPMPAEETKVESTPSEATTTAPVAGQHRPLQRTSTSSNLAATAASHQPNGPSTSASISTPASTNQNPSAPPPLKRRREDDEEEDELFTLMNRPNTRRKSLETAQQEKKQKRSPSPSEAKGKGKSVVAVSTSVSSPAELSSSSDEERGEKQGAAKRIKLSLKAALGLSKDKEKDGGGPNALRRSLSPATGVKDGDGG